MTTLNIVLSILDIVFAIAIIVLFLVQEGNDKGMGVVAGGSSDSFYSKAKGRTLEEQLKKWTVVCCIIFAIISVVLYLSIAKAWGANQPATAETTTITETT
ncbi:MAG: preprotein translocase subunit SecG [Clostridiales bacterium]|jgi:preprotein translocase subunit SecG|nr:preprotein translocase subunit SecG [Clostridiales bacterium]MBR4947846.1 preprotein translocase subunit SecG [Clostridiales bacterium]